MPPPAEPRVLLSHLFSPFLVQGMLWGCQSQRWFPHIDCQHFVLSVLHTATFHLPSVRRGQCSTVWEVNVKTRWMQMEHVKCSWWADSHLCEVGRSRLLGNRWWRQLVEESKIYLSAFYFFLKRENFTFGLRRRLEGAFAKALAVLPQVPAGCFCPEREEELLFIVPFCKVTAWLPPPPLPPNLYLSMFVYKGMRVTASLTALFVQMPLGASSVPALALVSGVKGFLSEAPAAATRCRKGLPAVLYSLPRWPLTAWQQPKQSSNFHALGLFARL